MARTTIDRASREFLKVKVTAPADVDLTAVPAHIAVVPASSRPTETAWRAGEWEGSTVRVLIGPGAGGLALRPGEYRVWLRVTDSPEEPIISAGTIRVT